jgi:hypothetical protein
MVGRPSASSIDKVALKALMLVHIKSPTEEQWRQSVPEAALAYQAFLLGAAGSTARLRVSEVNSCARELFWELGKQDLDEFSQKLAACFSWVRNKALKVSTGERLHPPGLAALVAAFKTAMKTGPAVLPTKARSSTSSGKSSSPPSAEKGQGSGSAPSLCQSRDEVFRAYGLAGTRQPIGLIEVSSDDEAEQEAEECDECSEPEEDVEDPRPEGDRAKPEEAELQPKGQGLQAQPGGSLQQQQQHQQEKPQPQQPQQPQPQQPQQPQQPPGKAFGWADPSRMVYVLVGGSGGKTELPLRKGAAGFCVADHNGVEICTELANLMLDPPGEKAKPKAKPRVCKRPAAKGVQKEQEGQKEGEEEGEDDELPEGSEEEQQEDEEDQKVKPKRPAKKQPPAAAARKRPRLAKAQGHEEDADGEAEETSKAKQAEGQGEAKAEGTAPEAEGEQPQRPAKAADEGSAPPRQGWVKMWYAPPRSAMALRQTYGMKRQLWQVSTKALGVDYDTLDNAFVALLEALREGLVGEAESKPWLLRHLQRAP